MLMVTLLVQPAVAQTTISGHALDNAGDPVAFANVQLLFAADSSFAAGTIAEENGTFSIQARDPSRYLLFISLIGYRDALTPLLVEAGEREKTLAPIVLAQEAIQMEEVAVVAKRELYEQKGDRMVINLANSVSLSGTTVLQVLERSPGVIVNRQSNAISMLGKDGVRMMVNGKLSYVPAEGLVQYLEGLSADNLESIELITSPPSSFDAEGNAGYINIKLKQNPDDGLNGSFTTTASYGKGERGSANIDVNYRRNRLSLYGSYSILWNGQQQVANVFRRVVNSEGIVESPTNSIRNPATRNNNARVSIDYDLSARTTIGATISSYDNRWSMNADNGLMLKTDGIPISSVNSINDEVNHWQHLMGNVNLRHKLTAGSRVSFDVDYLRYENSNPTDYQNTTIDLVNGEVLVEEIGSRKNTPLGIFVAKADWENIAAGRWTLSAGVKAALSRFKNESSFLGLVQSDWVAEAGLSPTTRLEEDVYAVYGNSKYDLGDGSSLQVGLRYERTDSDLRSGSGERIVDRTFDGFFPSVAYSQKIKGDQQLGLSYTRRITRPSFRDMAPFLYFLDPYTFFTGNAGLQPAIINTVKVDYAFKSLLTSVQYGWEDDSIARFQSHVLVEDNVQLLFPINLTGTKTATAMMALPVELASWWTTQNNAMFSTQRVESEKDGIPFEVRNQSIRFNSTHNISMPKDFSLELTGFYTGPSLFGTAVIESRWGVNAGIQRMLTDGAKLTFAVSDVFDTGDMRFREGSMDEPIFINGRINFAARTYALTYTRRFGGGKAKARRSTASAEESGRAQ